MCLYDFLNVFMGVHMCCSLLSNIFLYDYVIPGGAPTDNPKRRELLQYVLPQLECLKTLAPEHSPKSPDPQGNPSSGS